MNRLLRTNQFSRYVRRYNRQEVKSGGALVPLVVVASTVGAVWLYRNYSDIPKPALPTTPTFPRENRKDWEQFLPINEKHRGKKVKEETPEPTEEKLVSEVDESATQEPASDESIVTETVVEEVEQILEEEIVLEIAETPLEEESVSVEEAVSVPVDIAESEEVPVHEETSVTPEDTPVTEEAPVPEEEEVVVVFRSEITPTEDEPIPEMVPVETQTVEPVVEEPVVVEVEEPVEVAVEVDHRQRMKECSLAASTSTAAALAAIGRARSAAAHYIASKRVALEIAGDPDVRAAFWLQVTDAEARLQTATAEVGTTSHAAEVAIAQLELMSSEMDPDLTIVLITDIEGMKAEFAAGHAALTESNDQLSLLARLESELVVELQSKKEKYLAAMPPAPEEEDKSWRTLHTAFTDEDLKGLIFIAQRKLENVARELRELKIVQHEEVERALSTQREELLHRAEADLAELIAKQDEMIANKKQEIALELRNEFEEDLKLQLKRQSAAHAAHLTDELETQSAIQIAEAEEKLKTELNNLTSDYVEQINSERDMMTTSLQEKQTEYMWTLHQLLGYAEGVDLTLSEREQTEMEVTKLQCILLTVEEMHEAVMGVEIKPLGEIAANFKRFAGDIPAVQAIVDSLPTEAVAKGVLSPKALERTLPTLLEASQCQFMVGDDANGLFARLRSALNSRVTSWSDPTPLADDVDPTGNVDQIISAAKHYMTTGDIESAVRVLNQASGEPRRILAQWIHEARLSLEVKQALEALTAISQARILSARSYS